MPKKRLVVNMGPIQFVDFVPDEITEAMIVECMKEGKPIVLPVSKEGLEQNKENLNILSATTFVAIEKAYLVSLQEISDIELVSSIQEKPAKLHIQ